jgi:hyperosmotically inducible periplasmic protein
MLQGKPIQDVPRSNVKKWIPWRAVLACLILALLAACSIPSVLQTTAQGIYVVAVDERPAWTLAQDKQIELSVSKGFQDDPAIRNLGIAVYCYNGDVYLVGEYETAEQAMKAIAIANQTAGVESVTPYLLVKGGTVSCLWGDDFFIYAKVKMKFIGDEAIKSTNVNIDVVQCRVVLLGIVATADEVSRAIELAHEVDDVIEVKSFLVPTHQEGSGGSRPPQENPQEIPLDSRP